MDAFMVNHGKWVYGFIGEITPNLYQWDIKLLETSPWTMSLFSHMT